MAIAIILPENRPWPWDDCCKSASRLPIPASISHTVATAPTDKRSFSQHPADVACLSCHRSSCHPARCFPMSCLWRIIACDMEPTQIKPLPLCLFAIAIALIAFLIPTEPSSVGVMTPFHRSFQGFYGSDPSPW